MRLRNSLTVASNASGRAHRRVGDRPMQPRRIGIELLVSHDRTPSPPTVPPVPHRPANAGPISRRRSPTRARSGDGTGMHPLCGVGARASAPGRSATCVHRAAASCDLAELWVHTKTTGCAGACSVTRARRVRPARGGRTDGGHHRWTPAGRSTRPAPAHRGGGPAGWRAHRSTAATRRANGPTSPAHRRSPGEPGHPTPPGERTARAATTPFPDCFTHRELSRLIT